MKKHVPQSFLLRWTFGAFLLAAPALHGQTYNPNLFDISISFGCNCTCFCETNTVDTNNPVSVFLAANPVAYIASTAVMPAAGQMVPPHYTELLYSCAPAYYGNYDGTDYPRLPVGWTITQSSANGYYGYTPFLQVPPYNLNYPIEFELLNYYFYADKLLPAATGQTPTQSSSTCQPYPWDVNLTLQLQNGQYYYMEQQLVVGYDPEYYSDGIETPVTYVETNGLLTISLLCTNDGVTNVLQVSSATITARLLNNNIPAPLNLNAGWVNTGDFYTNWAWPLTTSDTADPNGPPGAEGTVQASLSIGSVPLSNIPLLVRADRAYEITVAYSLTNCIGGNSYNLTPITIDTGLVPPCTNMAIALYTSSCSICETNPLPHPTYCWVTNTGLVDIMGTPNVWPVLPPDPNDSGITMRAYDGTYNNSFSANLTGAALLGLPVPFQLPVLLVNQNTADFEKWATESLGINNAYEYFSSPVLYPVVENCNQIINLSNDFVMCPTNPAIVMGTVTLSGCVDSNYYNGAAALSLLQFAVYDNNGLPHYPAGNADPTLQFVTSIQATNGASVPSPFNFGHGFAITEFDNPGAFAPDNNYTGNYSLKLAGLQSRPSAWNVNDLHLVFGSPVNLDYHVVETNSPYTNINVTCGEILTNNISLCFGLYTIPVINARENDPNGIPPGLIYNYANVTVSGTGPGYTISQLNYNNFPLTTSPYLNEGYIPLFLPRGNYQYTTTVVTANGSHLVLGTNYFTVSCCTNSCLQVDCPTNKTVSCATNWSYDLPTVYSCCGTNYSINTYGSDVVNNAGACSMKSTRTWLITDCSGQTKFCSQTVTVSPPSSYSITFPAGVFELIANQLDNGSGNKISTLLSSLPNKSTVTEWNCASLVTSTKNAGTWSTDYTLAPGQGAFVKSASTVTVTFSGTPVCPPSTNTLCPCGTESLLSYGLDCPGTYEDITGLQPQEGSTVRRWNGSGYTINTFTGGAWTLGAPVLNVGAAAYFLIPCPTNPPVPPIYPPIRWGDITNAIIFPFEGGNGTFTYSNNAWSAGGYNYTLQWTTNLASPNWTTICNAVPTLGYTFTNAAPVSFYRLQQQTNQ